jgi:hypothetical protein
MAAPQDQEIEAVLELHGKAIEMVGNFIIDNYKADPVCVTFSPSKGLDYLAEYTKNRDQRKLRKKPRVMFELLDLENSGMMTVYYPYLNIEIRAHKGHPNLKFTGKPGDMTKLVGRLTPIKN